MRWLLRAAAGLLVLTVGVAGWALASWRLADARLPGDGRRAVVATGAVPSATALERAGIDQVLADAGDVRADGRVDGRRPAPERGSAVEVLARLQVVDARGGGAVRLTDASVRRRLAVAAGELVAAGYDGVHVAVRPWLDEDRAVLDLVDRLRRATADRGARLSVAVPVVEPARGLAFVSQLVAGDRGTWHTARSLRRVGQRTDQIVVRPPLDWGPPDWLAGSLARRAILDTAGSLAASRVAVVVALPEGGFQPGLRAFAQAARRVDTQPPLGLAVPAAWIVDGRMPAPGAAASDGFGSTGGTLK